MKTPAFLLLLLPPWTCWPELRGLEGPKWRELGCPLAALLSSEEGTQQTGAHCSLWLWRLIISNIVAAAGRAESNLLLFTLVAVMIKCNLISSPTKQLKIHLGASGKRGLAWHGASSKQPTLMLELTKHGSLLASPAWPYLASAHTPWPSLGWHSPRPLSCLWVSCRTHPLVAFLDLGVHLQNVGEEPHLNTKEVASYCSYYCNIVWKTLMQHSAGAPLPSPLPLSDGFRCFPRLCSWRGQGGRVSAIILGE